MTSTLEVSGAVDGEIFKRDKMGEYGYREPGEKRCSMNLNAAGPAERSLLTTSASNIRPSPLGFKSDNGAKRLGLGLPIRAGC
jgi:hypothetical protein